MTTTMKEATDHKRVSPEGQVMGKELARLTEPWIKRLAAQGEPDERCKSCAFTPGTVPNGCLQTQLDALKAVVEKVPFLCHQHDRKSMPCHGWFAAQVGMRATEKKKGAFPVTSCPWEFSPPDKD